MWDVIFALIPTSIFGIYNFVIRAAVLIAVCIATCLLSEYIWQKCMKLPLTVNDGSAVLTGLLLALNLTPTFPIWMAILGSIFAIIIVKQLFGGLGQNFMNPALAARCFLLISFGSVMTNYAVVGPMGQAVDVASSATPLAQLEAGEDVNILNAFLGLSHDVIGGSVAGMLLGGIYLWITGGITIYIPASILISFTMFLGIFSGHGFDPRYLGVNLCGGGIVMGAVFMATDPVTSPTNPFGQVIYGTTIGILSGIFRVFGSAPDSVSYAIIKAKRLGHIMDEYCLPKPCGLFPV